MSQVNYTVILKRTLEKLQNILGQLDMTLSELRDALTSAEYSAKITHPITAEGNIPIHIKKSDVAISVSPSFEDSAGNPVRALVDADHHAQVDVLSTANPPNLDVALSTRASESTLSVVKETLAVSKPKHKNVTTNATAGTVDTITFEAPLNTILIENSSETYDLYVSFDGGTTFKKIRPLQVLAISGIAKSENITSINIKSDGASQPVEILYQTYI